MEPIIYALPKSDRNIEPSEINIYFDNHPSPKLIKYGFNNIGGQLDMVALTSVPYYKAGLEFDFDRKDEKSISTKAMIFFKTKSFDQTFGEFWEIVTLFGLLRSDQTIFSLRNNATITDVVDTYQKLSNNKYNIKISGGNFNAAQNIKADLVFHKYSDVDIDENAAVQFIINDLSNLLSVQKEGSNMVLQVFSLQTQITAEIIYLLSLLYTDAYIMKPTIVSDLYDTKYIVLMGLQKPFKLTIPQHGENLFISSLGIKNIPNNFDTVIQCMNAEVIPKKYKRYISIKSYLYTKVYEGATFQTMITAQNNNATKWLETFTDLSKADKMLDFYLKKSTQKCNTHAQLAGILG
ncbi:FtsJ-like methyl transferase [Tupanvirus deep ocean]|uniref:FtsJ-like methyl transferase n=2 Tax=Tupanvirus TaxID=2094720 RepID=A0AC62A8L7_9VIRU|nr:FtsJ-like methyl transferase [Tupanvirus deep ocean]QKU33968.1 FtsJ-like methyl transferase [Tupanvirus deep ocean]